MKIQHGAFAASAVLAVLAAFAQEEAGSDAASVPVPAAPGRVVSKAAFTTLPLCRVVEGVAEVRKPNGEWIEAEEGKFYPLGSSYRVSKGSRLVVAFGPESTATIADGAEFGTRVQGLGEGSRTIMLVRGTVALNLADNLPEGAFFVTAPGFVIRNPAGESKVEYADKGDGDVATIRCVTGSMAVSGRHFDVPSMRSANEMVVRTSHDQLTTFLYGTSGDYVVRLDRGIVTKSEIDDEGKMTAKEEKGVAEWHLSPKTKVSINRLLPAIGERMSVFIMAYDAAGEPQGDGIRFCEGRAEINAGDLVAKKTPDEDEIAKRAAEATETTEAVDAEDDEGKSENESSDGEEESN